MAGSGSVSVLLKHIEYNWDYQYWLIRKQIVNEIVIFKCLIFAILIPVKARVRIVIIFKAISGYKLGFLSVL